MSKLIVVALPEDEARALVDCVNTSGKTTYTGPGITLFNGSQRIEQALDPQGTSEPPVVVRDAETEQDMPILRVTGGRDGASAVIHTS